ncbi:hypothetical protein SARC_05219 [Sphaeroforma arctica JP610]|uniref:Cyclin N-terminal domain-containing protein n=1 Tax=Sphaeroforma arctica JP610 TaxID=667725 RepID=A0A0L0G2R9_9EUKA|nr:hypothetical protein SARC_05219 [Sphaeroforma arctica JP610]KNC82493.1 hypothetical protein SARC_05219 [Sphaeroforma arctica JP610]|eukprot:XP_014156395.1 hypothetical protein SARC_05219 [Sphaeroforma arctica JP610]
MISLQHHARGYSHDVDLTSPSVGNQYYAPDRYHSEGQVAQTEAQSNVYHTLTAQSDQYPHTDQYYNNAQPNSRYNNEWNTHADVEAYEGHTSRAHEDVNSQFLDSTGPCFHLAPAFVEYTLALWEQECSQAYKLDLLNLVTKLMKYFDVCESALIVTMVYLKRLKTRFDECGFNAEKCSVQISVVCMMVATKFLYDIPTVNSLWAEMSDITTADINQMELELLRATNYSLSSSDVEADDARRTLSSWIRITEQEQIKADQTYEVNPINRTPPYVSPSMEAVYGARWSPLQDVNVYRHDSTEYRHDAYVYADYADYPPIVDAHYTQSDSHLQGNDIYRSDSGVLVGGNEHRQKHCSTDSGFAGNDNVYQQWSSGANNHQPELPSDGHMPDNPRWERPNNSGLDRRTSRVDPHGYTSFGNAENTYAADYTYANTDFAPTDSRPLAYSRVQGHQRSDTYTAKRPDIYIENPYGSVKRRSSQTQWQDTSKQQALAHSVDWSYSGSGLGPSYFN